VSDGHRNEEDAEDVIALGLELRSRLVRVLCLGEQPFERARERSAAAGR
jgi:hypothetical protein